MEGYAAGRHWQLDRPVIDRRCAVCDVLVDGHGLLDGRLAVREPVVRSRTDDVRIAILQSVFLQNDGQNLPRANDHRPDIYNDSDFKHGDLSTVVVKACGFIYRPHQTGRPIRPTLILAPLIRFFSRSHVWP